MMIAEDKIKCWQAPTLAWRICFQVTNFLFDLCLDLDLQNKYWYTYLNIWVEELNLTTCKKSLEWNIKIRYQIEGNYTLDDTSLAESNKTTINKLQNNLTLKQTSYYLINKEQINSSRISPTRK